MKKIVFSAIICLALAAGAQAQHQGAKNALAGRVTLHNYQFPFASQWNNADFRGGFEVEYGRHLNNFFNLAIPARLNKASLPTDDKGGTRDAGMASMDALLQLKYFRPDNFIYPYLFAGVGGMYENFETFNAAIPLGVGLNFRLGHNTYLSTKSEYRVGLADLRDHLQFSGGVLLMLGGTADTKPKAPPINDRDGDGVPDQTDLCPDTPGLSQFSGCPDTDGDGIPDGSDDCPTEAGLTALRGCPDRDGDGVPDKGDKCPDEAGPAANEGCPVTDRDGDGVPDEMDDCPDQPGPAATKGCPDRDGDGVADAKDNCPDVKGTVANNGCPTSPLVVAAKDKITNEVLPDTDIALVNSSGQVVKTGTTNSLGVVEFANVEPGNYTIKSKLYDLSLEDGTIAASDFNTPTSVQKTVYYDDPNFIIKGKVFYCNSPKPLPGVSLNLSSKAVNFLKTTVSKDDGEFSFYLDSRSTYDLYAKKESFLSQVVEVNAKNYDRSKSVFVRMEVCADEVKCGDAIRLNNSNSPFDRKSLVSMSCEGLGGFKKRFAETSLA